ncbi:hypothetical protein MUK42_06026 [Musa troglodytarum]|uniref:Uncharacterized protein n=1 Tax=Musa troglodytarum TaxID=320322 RepID=A0A9E7G7S5_9LILI|nr:hypothetical protein MUK42_06026 [Musa troglodytarum]
MLSHIRVLRAEENPLEVPPRHLAEMGAQAVVQYMSEYVKVRPSKSKMSCAQFCFYSRPNKRKRGGFVYVNRL